MRALISGSELDEERDVRGRAAGYCFDKGRVSPMGQKTASWSMEATGKICRFLRKQLPELICSTSFRIHLRFEVQPGRKDSSILRTLH